MDAALPATADAAPVMDEDAFRAFYARTARPLWAYLYRATRDGAAADDLLQETYYRLLRGRAAFENDDHRVHYLFRVAANLLTDTFRWRRSTGARTRRATRPRRWSSAPMWRAPWRRWRHAIVTCCGSPTPTARATPRSPRTSAWRGRA